MISVNDGAIDHVRDGTNGFLLNKPTEADDVSAMIHKALSLTEAERAAMGKTARQTMMALTWEAHLSKWMEVIAEL